MQQKKLYVGNLSYTVDEPQLNDLFASYGEINEVTLIKDRDTGRSKGFAFITFSTGEAAEKALEQDGKEFDGRPLKVNAAQERNDRGGSRRGGFGADKPGNKRGGFGGGKPGSRRGGFGGNKRGDRNDRNRW